MSGGLDSPAMTATACRILRSRSADFEVRAFTTVIDGADCNERYYAGSADRFGNPDPLPGFDWKDRSELGGSDSHAGTGPSPMNFFSDRGEYRAMAGTAGCGSTARVPTMRCGTNGSHSSPLDTATGDWPVGEEPGSSVIRSRRIPFFPGWFAPASGMVARGKRAVCFPEWLQPISPLVCSCESAGKKTSVHAVRRTASIAQTPTGHSSAGLDETFSRFDPEITGVASGGRHPFLDMRLLRYMLSVPVVPWCREKYLVCAAPCEEYCRSVLRRPKSSLAERSSVGGCNRLGRRHSSHAAGWRPTSITP